MQRYVDYTAWFSLPTWWRELSVVFFSFFTVCPVCGCTKCHPHIMPYVRWICVVGSCCGLPSALLLIVTVWHQVAHSLARLGGVSRWWTLCVARLLTPSRLFVEHACLSVGPCATCGWRIHFVYSTPACLSVDLFETYLWKNERCTHYY